VLQWEKMAYREEITAPDYERTEEPVRIIVYCNELDNDEIKLAFIGKCTKAHAFKNIVRR
jgi:hypothetical protein